MCHGNMYVRERWLSVCPENVTMYEGTGGTHVGMC